MLEARQGEQAVDISAQCRQFKRVSSEGESLRSLDTIIRATSSLVLFSAIATILMLLISDLCIQ